MNRPMGYILKYAVEIFIRIWRFFVYIRENRVRRSTLLIWFWVVVMVDDPTVDCMQGKLNSFLKTKRNIGHYFQVTSYISRWSKEETNIYFTQDMHYNDIERLRRALGSTCAGRSVIKRSPTYTSGEGLNSGWRTRSAVVAKFSSDHCG